MKLTNTFLSSVLDRVAAHIVVIDSDGHIVYTNRSWDDFACGNGFDLPNDWSHFNYLDECRQAVERGDDSALASLHGINAVTAGDLTQFELEYPCHGPDERRWFMMAVQALNIQGEQFVVLSHKEITKRKLAEEEASRLARIDSLTKIANRHEFERFLNEELKRCKRLGKPLAMALVDVDYFKAVNDSYGHQVGDQSLIKVANTLNSFVRRPSDLSARYGGDEFAIVWGDTDLDHAASMSEELLAGVADLRIPNENSPVKPYVTLSIGLAVLESGDAGGLEQLIARSDQLLYQAKSQGRNCLCCTPPFVKSGHDAKAISDLA